MAASCPPLDPARQPFIDRLRLEAQRRSAHHYLTEYIGIRSRILAHRKEFQDFATMDHRSPDRDYIRSLLGSETSAPETAPGTSWTGISATAAMAPIPDRPSGVTEDLAGDIWELAVV